MGAIRSCDRGPRQQGMTVEGRGGREALRRASALRHSPGQAATGSDLDFIRGHRPAIAARKWKRVPSGFRRRLQSRGWP